MADGLQYNYEGEMIRVLYRKIRFDKQSDRIGPDCPFTHWRLYFKSKGEKLCRSKFKKFGEGADIRPGVYAISCSRIEIGARVVLRPGTMLFADSRPGGKGIIIEDDVLIGSGVHFYTVNHKFDNPNVPIYMQGHYDSREIIVKKGAWIGANAILLPGVVIGENSVVGAGAVVTKSIPAGVVAVGNPARVIKKIENDRNED